MPQPPVPYEDIIATVMTWKFCLSEGHPAVRQPGNTTSAVMEAARLLRVVNPATVERRLDTAVALGLHVPQWRPVDGGWAQEQQTRYRAHDQSYRDAIGRSGQPSAGVASPSPAPDRSKPPASARASHGQGDAGAPGRGERFAEASAAAPATPITATPITATPEQMIERLVLMLRRGPLAVGDIAQKLGIDTDAALSLALHAACNGRALQERGGLWHLDTAPPLGSQRDTGAAGLMSDADGVIRVAACGDMHLCSKYARLDCLNDYYDEVARRGISTVLNTGNWIDGEAEFNKHDLIVHGMDAQMRYLAENYPQRDGVETWAITGADHEGWYARREGVDVGRYAARVMADAGREDWRDMGYMECFLPLVHAGTGKSSKLCLMHPGGGSAYALSYAPQKIVEGFDGGDKPAVLLLGHYHKSGYNLIRNVHTAQTGTFQDQTVFMRQKKLAAHLGGCFMELRLDPETGAVIECSYAFRNYFNVGYYNGRWSQHGPVEHAPRSARA